MAPITDTLVQVLTILLHDARTRAAHRIPTCEAAHVRSSSTVVVGDFACAEAHGARYLTTLRVTLTVLTRRSL
jgi:hypothetical protein